MFCVKLPTQYFYITFNFFTLKYKIMMVTIKKYFYKLLLAVGLSALLFTVSCEIADFGDINANPNAVTDPLTSALLTNSIARMGTIASNQATRSMAVWIPGLYCQYFSETQYTEESIYASTFPNWDDVYFSSLKDLQTIVDVNSGENKAKALSSGSNANQIAAARILKVYYFSHLTDMWGDLPYSEALIGEKVVQPKYDSQQDIYKGLFKELKEAAAQFDGGDLKGDILFAGNMGKWKKFANSQRAILALRISKVDAALGASEFKEAVTGGLIEANADNAVLKFPGGTFKNVWFEEYNGRKDLAISDVMEKTMKGISDPRMKVFGHPSAAGAVVGVPYGQTRADAIAFTTANPAWSFVLEASYRKENSPYDVLTAADVFLARAEAAKRGWTTENAANMYNAGIKASFEGWKVFTQAAYDAYIADAKVKLDGTADDLRKIGTQRWMTFYPRGSQGWAEWRRTGFPVLTPTPKAINSSKQIPRRYVYPTTEPNLNGANYQGAIGKLGGGDTPDGRVWWDK